MTQTASTIADKYNGKKLDSPNDDVVASDGSIWFTDPAYGIGGNYEGMRKGYTMQVPSMLQGESLTRLLQGAAAGAVATVVVGFGWGGRSLGSTATRWRVSGLRAVVAALAPVCAAKFRALPDAEAKTVALSKVDSWRRSEAFPKEFVTLPGETYPSSALVLTPKSAALN